MVGRAAHPVIPENAFFPVKKAHAVVVRDPKISAFSVFDVVDMVAGNAASIAQNMPIDFHAIPVVFVQPVARTDPDKSQAILMYR